ncbi:MAG: acetate--CoA ligase family protein [Burkholderiaceae bacterium]
MDQALLATLEPASVAVLGASDNPDKVGGRPIHFMLRHGFSGRIYPVNPGRSTVQGLPSYPDLDALPTVPDLAVIIVSGQDAVDAVSQCARLGVKAAIIIASGFAEVNEAGAEQQRRMVAIAAGAGMRLVGPNSQGFANFANGAVASFSTMFIEYPPADGPVSIVSQSGALSAAVYGLMRAAGLGVRHVLATGNEADATVPDIANLVVDDPGIGLVLLYMEHIARPRVLAEAARKARARSLPMVAIKSGRTDSGQKMAASHTGSLANEDRVVDAFLSRHGILRVRGLGELVRLAPLLLKGLRADGNRLVAISNSGASCVMAADAAESAGLTLAVPPEQSRLALREVLPSFSTSMNPIDLTGALLTDSSLFARVLSVLADNPQTDLVHIDIPVAGQGYDLAGFARAAAEFAQRTGKPLTISAWQPSVAGPFRAVGLPVFDTVDEGVAALAQLVRLSALTGAAPAAWPSTPPPPAPVLPAGDGPFLNEAQSLAVLAQAGLPVIDHRLCLSPQQAEAALAALGAPVVLKACSSGLPHKSEHGLVTLNLTDADALARQWQAHEATLATLGAPDEGMLVAAMRAGRREMLLGARHDPVFGTVVIVGDGGKYVESLPDTALLLAPFGPEQVREALRGLRVWPVLCGVRGEPPLDVEALIEAAVRLGRCVAAADGRIASVDANPVMMGAQGQGVWIADALVERAPGAAGPGEAS